MYACTRNAPQILCFHAQLRLLSFVSTSVVWLFGRNSNLAAKTTSGQTSPDNRWVYRSPTCFSQYWCTASTVLMALLYIHIYTDPDVQATTTTTGNVDDQCLITCF